jgi:hypothetical protein
MQNTELYKGIKNTELYRGIKYTKLYRGIQNTELGQIHPYLSSWFPSKIDNHLKEIGTVFFSVADV